MAKMEGLFMYFPIPFRTADIFGSDGISPCRIINYITDGRKAIRHKENNKIIKNKYE